jgi:hypothetical protein
MMNMDRRHLLRMAAPAVALPMVAMPLQAKEVRLVTREEIMAAFRFYDFMELQASDLNLRYQILIEMLFETNPETLRARLQELHDSRKDRSVLVDPFSGQTVPFDPSMYDETTGELIAMSKRRVDKTLAPVQKQLEHVSVPAFGSVLPKPKLRYRMAAWLMGWRA